MGHGYSGRWQGCGRDLLKVCSRIKGQWAAIATNSSMGETLGLEASLMKSQCRGILR